MAYKTREDLLNEIKEKNEEILELKKEAERLKRYEVYVEAANEIAAMQRAYEEAGFTKTQAFELVKIAYDRVASKAIV